jgi:hypothetical protein
MKPPTGIKRAGRRHKTCTRKTPEELLTMLENLKKYLVRITIIPLPMISVILRKIL